MPPPFLPERTPRPLTPPGQSSLRPLALHIGQGQNAIEVGVVEAPSRPTVATLQTAWKARRAGRASPLLLAALYEDKAAICGPSGEDPPVRFDLDVGQAERLCRAALEQPDRHAALAFVGQALPSLETAVPGLRNEGLFALHALSIDAQKRTEWREASSKSKAVVARRGQDLLSGLGFTVERLDNLTLLLRGKVRRSALAVLVDPSEIPEAGVPRFNNLSPISYALAKADAEGLPWVVMVHGDRLRLYPTSVGVGVGRRGRTETYVEVQTSVLSDEHLGYLWLLFSADSLDPEGPVAQLLEGSKRFAGDLADRLRERIYEEVVPRLATVIAGARKLRAPKAEDLDLTYRMALTVLFRLLFIAYAEDRDLLPYRTNEAYRRRSLKQKAQELADARIKGIAPAPGNSHWQQEVTQLFRAVAVGNPEWGVPAYDGGLFTTDPTISPPGAALAKIDLENGAFEPALQSLLLIETPEGPLGPVDFRALGVREFGTIYEGLLESELAVAETDLALDKDDNYVPHKPGKDIVVRKGQIYLHDRSGARKSSGSYFTKSFAVDHLLDRALEPALDDHLARLDAMDDADATESLFDFRVADIAMGSGHFLVAAIDRIERRLADYLNRRPLPGVRRELDYLRQAAEKNLADDASHALIEDAQLLRRLIARRCIYGVDLNQLSVELARLSIWIHTFVPGLPLTVLDHGLVRGNALVGIGSIGEIRERFEREATQLFPVDADNLLGQAKQPLARLGKLADASLKDVDAARSAMVEAGLALGPTRALCDIITVERFDADKLYTTDRTFQPSHWETQKDQIHASAEAKRARKLLDGLHPLHFPIAFPEVFLRRRSGFDVVVGNPPWEKVRAEHHEFWARHFPGLRGIKNKAQRDSEIARFEQSRPDLVALEKREREEAERTRDVIRSLPGMNTGHPDLFRAFMGRFGQTVVQDGGCYGVVLPGDAFKIKGNRPVREDLDQRALHVDVQLLTNKGEWVFDDVDGRKIIALVVAKISQNRSECTYGFRREFHDLAAWLSRDEREVVERGSAWLREYSAGLVQPTLPAGEGSISVIETMMTAPRTVNHPEIRIRRVYADVETSRDRDIYVDDNDGEWPVYGGDSFDLWRPDTGQYYAVTTASKAMERVQRKRVNSPSSSPYGAMPRKWRGDIATHPALSPRIAFRNVTNRTNRRTLLCALVPAKRILVETAPWVLWLDPDHPREQEAFLVGVMSSIPADWWMRRFVEGHVDEEAFNSLPIPAPRPQSSLRRRTVKLAGRLAASTRYLK
jgi:hypothetical protein